MNGHVYAVLTILSNINKLFMSLSIYDIDYDYIEIFCALYFKYHENFKSRSLKVRDLWLKCTWSAEFGTTFTNTNHIINVQK